MSHGAKGLIKTLKVGASPKVKQIDWYVAPNLSKFSGTAHASCCSVSVCLAGPLGTLTYIGLENLDRGVGLKYYMSKPRFHHLLGFSRSAL